MTSKTSGTPSHLLRDSQSFKVMNCHMHIQVYSETRILCILHSEFQGRRLTGIAKGSKQATHGRVTPAEGKKTVQESARLAHLNLIWISISHKGQLHRLRDNYVSSTTAYGYTIYIKLQPITNIMIRQQGKQPHVTSIGTSAELPPPACGPSLDQYLQPLTGVDKSSSLSSRASKWHCNVSPAPPPHQLPYQPSEAEAWPLHCLSPSRCPPEHQPYHPSDTDLVAELRAHLGDAEEEIDNLEWLHVQSYEVGYQ